LKSHQSNGEIGTLNQDGKQIGGFYDWTLETRLEATKCEKWASYKLVGQIYTTPRFWLLEKPTSDSYEVNLYQLIRDTFALINTSHCKIEIPNVPLNKINQMALTWTN
jgi:hypothetical protein